MPGQLAHAGAKARHHAGLAALAPVDEGLRGVGRGQDHIPEADPCTELCGECWRNKLCIDALGNDFAMGSPGTCGKDGQGVPVGVGLPTLRVDQLTVGGTEG